MSKLGDEYLTADDVQRELGIPKSTQATMRHRKQIPFIRLGGGRIIRYKRAELEAWLAAKSVPPATAA